MISILENSSGWIRVRLKLEFYGITGICFRDGKYLFLTQHEGAKVSLHSLNNQCMIIDSFELKKDVHSIIPFEDDFLINNTRTNRLTK